MNVDPGGALRPMAATRSGEGFSSNCWMAPRVIEVEDPHATGALGVHGQRGDGYVGLAVRCAASSRA